MKYTNNKKLDWFFGNFVNFFFIQNIHPPYGFIVLFIIKVFLSIGSTSYLFHILLLACDI